MTAGWRRASVRDRPHRPAAIVLVAALALARCGGVPSEEAPATPSGPLPVAEAGNQVDLYFPSVAGLLVAERREVEATDDPDVRIRQALEALLAGPAEPGRVAPLPEGVRVAYARLNTEGVAYVDLVAPEQGDPPSSGSLAEMLTVYSLVDTILLNVGEARAVVLLWNGRQRASFAGHLDTARPLTANLDLVATPPAGRGPASPERSGTDSG